MAERPKRVTAKLTHGRSILFSLDGQPVRLRKGMPASPMPYEVYLRHSYKLELTEDSAKAVNDFTHRAIVHETTQMAATQTEVRKAEPKTPLWPLRSSPEEWLELHGRRTDLSPKMKKRLELARTLVNGT